MSKAEVSSHTSSSAGADDWYCMAFGQELGPLSFDELAEYVGQGQMVAEDEVKLGAAGKWRRIGSIGRLVAILPYQGTQAQTSQPAAQAAKPVDSVRQITRPVATALQSVAPTARASVSPTQPAAPIAVASVGLQAGELEFIKAKATYEATEQAVKHLIPWAYSPNCNPQWWTVIDGVENGPIEFATIFEWAMSGRIQPTDYVRNGLFGQYGSVGNLPGLFSAAGMLKQAREAFEIAKSHEAQAVAVAPTVASPLAVRPAAVLQVAASAALIQHATTNATVAPKVSPELAKPSHVAVAQPERPKPIAPTRTTPQPMPTISATESRPSAASPSSSGGFSGSMGGGSSTSRRISTPPRPSTYSQRSSGSSFFASLLEAHSLGKIGIVAVVLLGVGWMCMPAGRAADIKRYKELKQLLTDVRAKREAKATDFSDLKDKAQKLTAEFTPVLKTQASSYHPAKQYLLWAVRDDLPRMMKEYLLAETQAEKNFAARLDHVAMHLSVKDN